LFFVLPFFEVFILKLCQAISGRDKMIAGLVAGSAEEPARIFEACVSFPYRLAGWKVIPALEAL
jgi:hypothetical protein